MRLKPFICLPVATFALAMGIQPITLSQSNLSEIDYHIRILQSDPSSERRIEAAQWLAKEIRRPTENHVRQIAGVIKGGDTATIRCSAAAIFGAIGRQSRFHTGSRRPPPDETQMLGALRHAFVNEEVPSVRSCIVAAASEFDSSEAQVVIDRGKSDINPKVRDTAVKMERIRADRLRSGTGVAPASQDDWRPRVDYRTSGCP